VQYHPEASPGPHDSRYLFQRFIDMMEKEKSKTNIMGKFATKAPRPEVKTSQSIP
jgi:hypothetical protein